MEGFTEVKSTNTPWAFTYKILGKTSATSEDYCPAIEQLRKYGFVKAIEKEKDSKGLLHIHGIVLLRKGFMRKRLSVQGFHCHLTEVTNESGWMRYIQKDQVKTPQYLFSDDDSVNFLSAPQAESLDSSKEGSLAKR